MASTSFASDIAPLFTQFRAQMLWRLDLTNYDQVKANATIIWQQIATQSMPPPPFPPLTTQQIATFQLWMNENYPP